MYICTKAITLSGNRYVPGDIINDGDIIPKRVGDLVAWGYITVSEAGKTASGKVETKEIKVETKETEVETKETETVEKVEEPKTKKKKKEV